MRVYVDGVGQTDLLPEHFVAEGGEGRVYARDGRAFKVWTDAGRAPPPGKLALLSQLRHPAVIGPEALIRDSTGACVGFAMAWVEGASPLAAWVAPGPRLRAGVDAAAVGAWARGLADVLAWVHGCGAVIGDLSEGNVLVDAQGRLRLIDVDSWAVGAYPATAFTPSTRDPRAAPLRFDAGTDWFAFAVVSFLLLTGLHPYRGRHPAVPTLEARMQAGISALDPAVVWPPAALGRDAIPPGWRDWYRAVLEDTHRGPPPDAHGHWPSLAPAPAASGEVRRTPVSRLDGPILGFAHRDGGWLAWTATSVWRDGHRLQHAPSGLEAAVFSPRAGRPVGAAVEAGRLRLVSLEDGAALPVLCAANAVIAAGGVLVALAGDQLIELRLHELGDRLMPVLHPLARVLPRATRLWPGFAEQRLLGAAWLHLPLGPGRCPALRVPELDGRTVLAGAHADGVVHLLVHRAGRMDRVVVRHREGRTEARVEIDVPAFEPQVVVLDSGVAVLNRPDGALELVPAGPGERGARLVPGAAGEGRLVRLAAGLGEVLGAEVVGLRLG